MWWDELLRRSQLRKFSWFDSESDGIFNGLVKRSSGHSLDIRGPAVFVDFSSMLLKQDSLAALSTSLLTVSVFETINSVLDSTAWENYVGYRFGLDKIARQNLSYYGDTFRWDHSAKRSFNGVELDGLEAYIGVEIPRFQLVLDCRLDGL